MRTPPGPPRGPPRLFSRRTRPPRELAAPPPAEADVVEPRAHEQRPMRCVVPELEDDLDGLAGVRVAVPGDGLSFGVPLDATRGQLAGKAAGDRVAQRVLRRHDAGSVLGEIPE